MNTSKRKRVGYYIKRDDGKLDLCIHKKDFDQSCIDELDHYSQVIFKLQPTIISYEMVNLSYYELKKHIELQKNIWLEQLTPGKGSIDTAIDYLAESTQKVTNLLSSATSFLSSTQVKLRKDYGEEANQYTEWNNLRNSLHGDNFSYRLLYELRNYSQHYNIPIAGVDIHLSGIMTETPIAGTTLYINTIELLNSGWDWNRALKSEISALGKKENLMPLIDDYVCIIKKLVFSFFSIFQKELVECYQYMKALHRVLQVPINAVPVVFVGDTKQGQPVPNSIEYIPAEQMFWLFKKYQELQSSNKINA